MAITARSGKSISPYQNWIGINRGTATVTCIVVIIWSRNRQKYEIYYYTHLESNPKVDRLLNRAHSRSCCQGEPWTLIDACSLVQLSILNWRVGWNKLNSCIMGGLCPSVQQSGNHRIWEGWKMVIKWRRILIEAANTASRIDSRLRKFYLRVAKRHVHNKCCK